MALADSFQLSAVSFQPSAFSSELSALSLQLSAVSCQLSTLSFRFQASSDGSPCLLVPNTGDWRLFRRCSIRRRVFPPPEGGESRAT